MLPWRGVDQRAAFTGALYIGVLIILLGGVDVRNFVGSNTRLMRKGGTNRGGCCIDVGIPPASPGPTKPHLGHECPGFFGVFLVAAGTSSHPAGVSSFPVKDGVQRPTRCMKAYRTASGTTELPSSCILAVDRLELSPPPEVALGGMLFVQECGS